jgi:hypothetical protein
LIMSIIMREEEERVRQAHLQLDSFFGLPRR